MPKNMEVVPSGKPQKQCDRPTGDKGALVVRLPNETASPSRAILSAQSLIENPPSATLASHRASSVECVTRSSRL